MRNWVKVERARHDMTQADLAAALGVTRQTILAIEKRKFVPSTLLALKMARLFQKPVETLFELEEADG